MYLQHGRFNSSSRQSRTTSYPATLLWRCALRREAAAAVAAAADRALPFLLPLPPPLVAVLPATPPETTGGGRRFKKSPGSYLLRHMHELVDVLIIFGDEREAALLLASLAEALQQEFRLSVKDAWIYTDVFILRMYLRLLSHVMRNACHRSFSRVQAIHICCCLV